MIIRRMLHQKINDNKRNSGTEAICSSLNHQLKRFNIDSSPATMKESKIALLKKDKGAARRDCQILSLDFCILEKIFYLHIYKMAFEKYQAVVLIR